MESAEFKLGDRVRLKGGYWPVMTVDKVYAPVVEYRYRCVLQDAGGIVQHEFFRAEHLERAPPTLIRPEQTCPQSQFDVAPATLRSSPTLGALSRDYGRFASIQDGEKDEFSLLVDGLPMLQRTDTCLPSTEEIESAIQNAGGESPHVTH
jgi:uncharacterized protein YodC (DUF2158 family)